MSPAPNKKAHGDAMLHYGFASSLWALARRNVPTWNVKELREKASGILNAEDGQFLSDALDAFHWKYQAVQYHLLQADECFKDFCNLNEIQAAQELMSRSPEFELAAKIREICLVSSVMTVSTLPDALAQVVNLLFLEDRFGVHGVYLARVTQKVNSPHIKEKLESLLESKNYNYAKSFAETVKHINLVKPNYQVSFENGLHGVQFKAFRHKGNSFPDKIDTDLIELVKSLRAECLGLGAAINEELR